MSAMQHRKEETTFVTLLPAIKRFWFLSAPLLHWVGETHKMTHDANTVHALFSSSSNTAPSPQRKNLREAVALCQARRCKEASDIASHTYADDY